jgi:hemerythrin
MSLAYWRDYIKINHPKIDEEHRQLIDILESLHCAISLGQDHFTILGFLEQFLQASLSHCETEESLMVSHHYPHGDDHIAAHEEFLSELFNLHLKLEQREISPTLDMVHDLATELSSHCGDFDVELVQFINQSDDLSLSLRRGRGPRF